MKIVGTQSAVIALVVIAAACAGDEGGGDDGGLGTGGPSPSSELTPERFERAMAEAVCEAADLCHLGSFTALVRKDGRCVEALQRYIGGSGSFAHLRAAVRYGEVHFDASAARACLDSFTGRCPQSFDLLLNGWPPLAWCPEAFPDDCNALDKLPWMAPLARGAHCGVTGSGPACAAGLGCGLASSACQPCGMGDDGLDCQEPTEALIGIYLTDRPEGSSCAVEGVLGYCNAGLFCSVDDAVTCVTPRPCLGDPSCQRSCD